MLRILAIFSFLATSIAAFNAQAWQDSTGSLSGATGTSSVGGSAGGDGGNLGGGAATDFFTLIDLIQRTVDPEDWADTQGGNNTIIQWPAGVYVDPKGRLQRVESLKPGAQADLKQRLSQMSKDQQTGYAAVTSGSDLRMISLKKLDQALAAVAKGQSTMTLDMLRLGGIHRISHVLVDASNEDIVLAGPADPNQLGFYLEDLAVLCGVLNQGTAPLGCSIEPKQERLLATQEFLAKPGTSNLLSRSPKRFAEQLGEVIGDYDVEVFGMNPRSGTAIALVAADEHMKQLAFGKVSLPISIKSYFDHLEKQNTVPSESLIRWWFAYNDQPVLCNESRDLFQLPVNSVCVLSEQQFVTATGRKATGSKDPAADAFAAEMSQKMDKIRGYDQNYARLCCVFETSLALQLALDQSGMADLRPWFPNLCGLGKQEQKRVNAPKNVPGLVTTQVLKKQKTNVAVISGGVTVSPKSKAESANIQSTSLLSGSNVPSKPSQDNNSWWWD